MHVHHWAIDGDFMGTCQNAECPDLTRQFGRIPTADMPWNQHSYRNERTQLPRRIALRDEEDEE